METRPVQSNETEALWYFHLCFSVDKFSDVSAISEMNNEAPKLKSVNPLDNLDCEYRPFELQMQA